MPGLPCFIDMDTYSSCQHVDTVFRSEKGPLPLSLGQTEEEYHYLAA